MSAASFLGISALVYSSGFDGLIYSIGFLVGWPIIMFLMAEPLRNLGRFTFADVVVLPARAAPMRTLAASGTLVVVAFYLIAQMVGAGKLIQLLFGLPYTVAVIIVGVLMILYVTFGGMVATTWVQIIKACLLLFGATVIAFSCCATSASISMPSSPRRSRCIRSTRPSCAPGGLVADPISAISLGLALMFGTAGLPHILMRFFTVADAKEARKSVLLRHGVHRLLLHPHLHHRLRRDRAGRHQSGLRREWRDGRRRQHGGGASRARCRRRSDEWLHLGCRLRDDPRRGLRPDARGRERRQP